MVVLGDGKASHPVKFGSNDVRSALSREISSLAVRSCRSCIRYIVCHSAPDLCWRELKWVFR